MALANHRIRVFKNVADMEQFIITDADINAVVSVGTDDNGTFILVYTVA